jgi:hypothetical protein
VDHPGAVPISTAQVLYSVSLVVGFDLTFVILLTFNFFFILKGEELRKLIGAAAYIECSSKTQQVLSLLPSIPVYFENQS